MRKINKINPQDYLKPLKAKRGTLTVYRTHYQNKLLHQNQLIKRVIGRRYSAGVQIASKTL